MTDYYSSDILKAQMITNLKTGNIIVDTVIVSIIISFIGWIINKIQTFNILKIIEQVTKKKYKFTIKSYYKISGKEVFPTEFQSIIHNINTRKISFKEKIVVRDHFEDPIFIPYTEKPIKITDKIYIELARLYTEETEYNSDRQKIERKVWYINLYTNDSLETLNEYVLDCLAEFIKYKDSLSNKIKYVYKITDFVDNEPTYKSIEFNTSRNFTSVFFEEKDRFLSYLKSFTEGSKWFEQKQCPRHLGILLHGEPGCGKTSFIKALANETRRNIVTIDLSVIKTNEDLCRAFTYGYYSKDYNDYIYILEDIDCMSDIVLERKGDETFEKKDFHEIIKSEKMNMKDFFRMEKDKLTLSGLLNVIDGLIEMPGRIIVITTNHVEKLDKALIRPGRIDFKIEMKKATRKVISSIIEQFYDEPVELSSLQKVHDYQRSPAEVSDIVKSSFFLGKSLNECIRSME